MRRSAPVRVLVAFGRFWWDFLVGDTPEIFVAVLVTLGAVALVSRVAHHPGVGAAALAFLVLGALSLSLARAARRR